MMDGFSPASPPRIFWNSRNRSACKGSLENSMKEDYDGGAHSDPTKDTGEQDEPKGDLSERRRALFEPLQPTDAKNRNSTEELLPPPDFDSTSYPKGWLVGKKRKLVNVDVVESMRRIAIQEMNRKDREIGGLNEQLEEDSKCLEHLQTQLLEERRRRADVERENKMLQNQISMLIDMLQENQSMEEDEEEEEEEGALSNTPPP